MHLRPRKARQLHRSGGTSPTCMHEKESLEYRHRHKVVVVVSWFQVGGCQEKACTYHNNFEGTGAMPFLTITLDTSMWNVETKGEGLSLALFQGIEESISCMQSSKGNSQVVSLLDSKAHVCME